MTTKRRVFRRLALGIFASMIGYGVYYCWVSFPIISGYGAKVLCSAVFVSGRSEQEVRREDLASFPLTLAHYTVDYRDSSVTGTVWGMAEKRVIYRKGLGSTLVSEWPERQVRDEHFPLAEAGKARRDTIPWPMGDRLADTVPAGL